LTSLIDRLKPRASARTQLLMAMAVWFSAALILGGRGVYWVPLEMKWLPWVVMAAALGWLKARFLLEPVARRIVARILERGRDRCAGGFFAWQSWLMVLTMVAAGHALRLTAISRPILGLVYILISVALIIAIRVYWQAVRAE